MRHWNKIYFTFLVIYLKNSLSLIPLRNIFTVFYSLLQQNELLYVYLNKVNIISEFISFLIIFLLILIHLYINLCISYNKKHNNPNYLCFMSKTSFFI